MEDLEARLLLTTDLTASLAYQRADLDRSGTIDAADIDRLSQAVVSGSQDLAFDVNRDGAVTAEDRTFWVESLRRSYFGDADLDGQFGTQDLILVFQAGLYESGLPGPAKWASGDWDGDTRFGTGDLVIAFQQGGYEQGWRPLMKPTAWPDAGTSAGALVTIVGQADPFVFVRVEQSRDVTSAAENECDRAGSASERAEIGCAEDDAVGRGRLEAA